MPLQIELETDGPDRGVFAIRGLPEVGSEILAAVRRVGNGRYLTVHGLWVETPSWHPCARLDTGNGAARFAAESALVAGIRTAVGAELEMHVRRGGFSDLGPLVVQGPGPAQVAETRPTPESPIPVEPKSDADATVPAQPVPEGLRAPDRAPRLSEIESPVPAAEESDLVWNPAPRPSEDTGAADPVQDLGYPEPRSSPPSPPKAQWLALVLVVVAVLALLIGIAVWIATGRQTSGPTPQPQAEPTQPRIEPARTRTEPTATPTESSPPTRRPVPTEAPAPARASTTTGKARFLELKAQNLSPETLFEHGAEADRAGDCEAAIRILIDAAKRDPGLAERLGQRYDPDGFQPSACFPEPKPDSAMVWYQNAAERDIPRAQRRYGELLLDEAASGPIYQDALDWLRKAAEAGDQAAAQRLQALGER